MDAIPQQNRWVEAKYSWSLTYLPINSPTFVWSLNYKMQWPLRLAILSKSPCLIRIPISVSLLLALHYLTMYYIQMSGVVRYKLPQPPNIFVLTSANYPIYLNTEVFINQLTLIFDINLAFCYLYCISTLYFITSFVLIFIISFLLFSLVAFCLYFSSFLTWTLDYWYIYFL